MITAKRSLSVLLAIPSLVSAQSSSGTSTSSAPATVSTSSPSSTASPAAVLPNYPLDVPAQPWCTDPIFCYGDILQAVQLASVYVDSKTFVDKPTSNSTNATVTAFQGLGSNITVSQLEQFLEADFKGEGLELETVPLTFNASAPSYLSTFSSMPILQGWVTEVISYWSLLIRQTNNATLCASDTQCDSSLIPLNHTVVVPGGRFREVYYWDSFWIIEGLLNSGLPQYALSLIMNFMDELEVYGFIPNGGRKYYLNRSQPPLFTQMVSLYISHTNDTSILARALPLADKEFQWWQVNRSVSVTSPYTNSTYNLYRYAVVNTAPRPEGYLEDWETANLAQPALNVTEKEALYSELASGAESGWDYSSRFIREPFKNISDPLESLRSLNIRSIIPVDLNSILTKNHFLLADLYDQYAMINSSTNSTARASLHRQQGNASLNALYDLFWDPVKLSFYDFNTTSNERNVFWSPAAYYPLWFGFFPKEIINDEKKMFSTFSGLNMIFSRYNGTVPASLQNTTLQWDFPNAWPPHSYIAAKALMNVPSNFTTPYSTMFPLNASSFSLIPSGQLGLNESQLPIQSTDLGQNFTGDQGRLNGGGFAFGGNVTSGEGWKDVLIGEVANRYVSSAFCSWYSSGGSLPGILDQLPAAELAVSQSTVNNTGNMFEKFSTVNVDAAGGGGEYTTVVGFGWTNGVLIWLASSLGKYINQPQCPAIIVEPTNASTTSTAALFAGYRVPTH